MYQWLDRYHADALPAVHAHVPAVAVLKHYLALAMVAME